MQQENISQVCILNPLGEQSPLTSSAFKIFFNLVKQNFTGIYLAYHFSIQGGDDESYFACIFVAYKCLVLW